MGKKVYNRIFSLALLFSFVFALPVFGSNCVNTIEVQALLNEDGSMHISQSWEGEFDEGTEVYIPMNAPRYLTISQLAVSDQNGRYETMEEWNLDWSFEEKAKKCGINPTEDGYEICFGISQYGENHYNIEYTLENAVGAYSDRDGVNFRFVNDEMNTTPTEVRVEIRLADGTPITHEIADIWGFGYDGQVEFSDGAIVAYTDNPIDSENHVTVMFSFQKGILSPERQEEDSFEAVKERAFEGSDYDASNEEEGSFFELFFAMAIFMGIPIVLVAFFVVHSKKKRQKKLKQFTEAFGYFREIPNEGNLNASYVLGTMFELCEEGAILATGMLRLIQLGCLSPMETQEVGFMGKAKETVSLRLMGEQNGQMNAYDEHLYTILERAAGSDAILQAKELERFAQKNDTLLRAYIQKCENGGTEYLGQKHAVKRWNFPSKLTDLTPAGEQELGQLMGLKRYLADFSLIAERGVKEMPIWRELLTYAMLFGIADEVAEQMKALYPDISRELTEYSQSMTTAYSYHYLLYSNMRRAERQREQAERNDGGGGFASFGGGGGSIGGGSGGGTR